MGVEEVLEEVGEALGVAVGAAAAVVAVEEIVGVDGQGEDGAGAAGGLDEGIGKALGVGGIDEDFGPQEIIVDSVERNAGEVGEVIDLRGLSDESVIVAIMGGFLADKGEMFLGEAAGQVEKFFGLFEIGRAPDPEDGLTRLTGQVWDAVAVGQHHAAHLVALLQTLGVGLGLGKDQRGLFESTDKQLADQAVLFDIGTVGFIRMGGAVDEAAVVAAAKAVHQGYAGRSGLHEINVGVGAAQGLPYFDGTGEGILLKLKAANQLDAFALFGLRLAVIGDDATDLDILVFGQFGRQEIDIDFGTAKNRFDSGIEDRVGLGCYETNVQGLFLGAGHHTPLSLCERID